MKLTLFLVASVLITFPCVSQSDSKFYFDIGVKGGYGLNLLINQNILNDKNVDSEFSFGPSFGGRIGGNFNEKRSVNLEVLYSGFNQQYSVKSDSLHWNKTISFSTLDLALLYRNFVNGSYMEIGPEVSLVQSAVESNSVSGSANAGKLLTPNYFSGIFGFGANFLGNDNISIMAGVRASYSFTDIISDLGGKSQDRSFPLNEPFYKNATASYASTNPLTVRLMLEISFDLGYFTRSKCNKKRLKFLSF